MNMTAPTQTETHTLTISAFHWQALALFVDPKDVRYHINGINISAHHLTATNGHVLLCLEHGHDFGDFLPKHGITVELFKAGTKRVDGKDPTVSVTISEPGGTNYGVVQATCTASPGAVQNLEVRMQDFPDFERVIPKHSDNDTFSHANHIDGKYLELLGKTGVLLAKGAGRTTMPMNICGPENSAMLVTFRDLPQARAVVMPLQLNAR
tara:strand:+ start:51 stop:677 length:627 start_codon:yes stop_codon:yes gene_type:complete